jgi:hypothetical protein
MKKILSKEQKEQRARYAKQWRADNPEKVAKHSKNSRIKNKDRVREQQRKWRNKNLEYQTQKSKEWYDNNKDRVRDLQLKKEFGISLDKYNEMRDTQNGVCFLCGGGPDARFKNLAVDHDHTTGKVRKLLCRGCNVGIGNLRDDPELLEKAAKYIRNHK